METTVVAVWHEKYEYLFLVSERGESKNGRKRNKPENKTFIWCNDNAILRKGRKPA
jgi:hypothetical protein